MPDRVDTAALRRIHAKAHGRGASDGDVAAFLAKMSVSLPALLDEIDALREEKRLAIDYIDQCKAECGTERVSGEPVPDTIRCLRSQRDTLRSLGEALAEAIRPLKYTGNTESEMQAGVTALAAWRAANPKEARP